MTPSPVPPDEPIFPDRDVQPFSDTQKAGFAAIRDNANRRASVNAEPTKRYDGGPFTIGMLHCDACGGNTHWIDDKPSACRTCGASFPDASPAPPSPGTTPPTFTAEDVELLTRCADGCDGTVLAEDDDDVFADGIRLKMRDVNRLRSIASRLAALLPPPP